MVMLPLLPLAGMTRSPGSSSNTKPVAAGVCFSKTGAYVLIEVESSLLCLMSPSCLLIAINQLSLQALGWRV